ncbi:MAG: hypothetical protein PF693_00770 [Spirochaetia bacterium]|jgi:hypothetical protein|nr:hypothetical protein [Spirochaetia bacterium]
MSVAVTLPDTLVNTADIYKKINKRSRAGQIEYWATMGKIALDNPELPMEFIEEILIAQEEAKHPELLEEFSLE